MPKFRKKPVVITAFRILVPNVIKTLEGEMKGERGDWRIIGVNGEQYFCKDEIFRKTYEPVDEDGEKALTEDLEEVEKCLSLTNGHQHFAI